MVKKGMKRLAVVFGMMMVVGLLAACAGAPTINGMTTSDYF